MADISLSLKSIQNTRTVNIEGEGVLTIRKLGSGEDLDLSVKRRRMNKLIDELNSIDFSGLDVAKKADLKKLETLSKKAEAIQEEIAQIKLFEFELYKSLLSDDKDGKVVDLVMKTLSDKERAVIFNRAFSQDKVGEDE